MFDAKNRDESSSRPFLDPQLRRPLIAIAWVVLFLLVVYTLSVTSPLLRRIGSILSPFIVGLIVAYVLDPIVSVVQRRLHLGRIGGILVLLVLGLTIVAVLMAVIIPIVIDQVAALVQGIDSYISDHIESDIDRLLSASPFQISEATQREIRTALENWKEHIPPAMTAVQQVFAVTEGLLARTAGFLGGVIGWGMSLAFIFIIAIYFLLDFDRIQEKINDVIPIRHRERAWRVLSRIHVNLSGFLRGQLIVCLSMGTMITVGLLIVGPRKYAVLIGLLAGVANFVPYLGPIVGIAPALLWALVSPEFATVGERAVQSGLILVVFALAQNIDGFFISPRVIGKQAAMHPLLVMLALIAGAQGGIAGMVVAVPVMIICKALFVELLWNPMREHREIERGQITTSG